MGAANNLDSMLKETGTSTNGLLKFYGEFTKGILIAATASLAVSAASLIYGRQDFVLPTVLCALALSYVGLYPLSRYNHYITGYDYLRKLSEAANNGGK